MTDKELKKIIDNHRHWLKRDCDGWETMRADLHNANLCGASLWGADLRGASLEGANLCGANLSSASLWGADLRGANLCGANLWGADLSGVDLLNVNLLGADLCDANLCNAKNICVPIVCPDTGSFIGFKKAGAYIIMLEIPADAKRLSSTGRKCRCNKAKVIEIQHLDGTKANADNVPSDYDFNFIYSVGTMVEVPDFDEDRWNECSTGIHFFINRQEAVNYR